MDQTPTTPSASFHIATYPHILEQIICYSTNSSLLTLARCSRSLHHDSIPMMYRVLNLQNSQQLKDMLSQLEDIALPPHFPSRFLDQVQRHTRSIHIHDYGYDEFPESCPFKSLKYVVLYPATSWPLSSYLNLDEFAFGALKAMDLSHLYFRIPEASSHRPQSSRYKVRIEEAPTHYLRKLTVIIPYSKRETIIQFPSSAGDLIIVFLPPQPETTTTTSQEPIHFDWVNCFNELLSIYRDLSFMVSKRSIIVVGTEVSGLTELEICSALASDSRPGRGPDRDRVDLLSFAEWLDEQEFDMVLTGEEINGFRAASECESLLLHPSS